MGGKGDQGVASIPWVCPQTAGARAEFLLFERDVDGAVTGDVDWHALRMTSTNSSSLSGSAGVSMRALRRGSLNYAGSEISASLGGCAGFHGGADTRSTRIIRGLTGGLLLHVAGSEALMSLFICLMTFLRSGAHVDGSVLRDVGSNVRATVRLLVVASGLRRPGDRALMLLVCFQRMRLLGALGTFLGGGIVRVVA